MPTLRQAEGSATLSIAKSSELLIRLHVDRWPHDASLRPHATHIMSTLSARRQEASQGGG